MTGPRHAAEGGIRQFKEAARSALHPETYGRAADAVAAVRAEYAGKIDAIYKDRSLTPEQRAAAILELRRQRKATTRAIRRRIIEEEKQSVRGSCDQVVQRPLKGIILHNCLFDSAPLQ